MASNKDKPFQNYGGFIILCATLPFLPFHTVSSSGEYVRSVFPHDFVRFPCAKSLGPFKTAEDLKDKEVCTWEFSTGEPQTANDTVTQISKECIRATNATVTKQGTFVIYEGYLEVPEKARLISCKGDENTLYPSQEFLVQNVRLAEPLSGSTPKIILQRFSGDYVTRLGAHDVTNQEVSLDGDEVDSIKLLCVHDAEVYWTNYTESARILLQHLNSRDMKWLESQLDSTKLTKKWKTYLDFMRNIELESISGMKIQLRTDRTIYSVPLIVKNVTNSTTRKYECRTAYSDQSSHVSIDVQHPRVVGADDILLIQQIISILEALANGKGTEPWYTLASMLSIVLLLFAYYCKKKLENPPAQSQNPPGTSNHPSAAAALEEVELRTKLQPQPEPKPQPISQRISPIKEREEEERRESQEPPAIIDTTQLTEVSVRKDP